MLNTMSNSFLLSFTTLYLLHLAATATASGSWRLLQSSVGVSAMHMQLLPIDHVVLFDRTNFGPSNLSLPLGSCRSNDLVFKPDCTAHSVDYDVSSNTFRPLTVHTDTWCSSGSLLSDGRLAQSGGSNDGERSLRIFNPHCKTKSSCDWHELAEKLLVPRWYASNHRLPDGRMIIVGGRAQFNYEFYPKNSAATDTLQNLPFLSETNDKDEELNLYPYVFLNVDGNLFIFANNRAILLDYTKNVVVRTYPKIPGHEPRSYPCTGSAVLLPLKKIDSKIPEAEVLVCGGAPKGAFLKALKGKFVEALNTCARIKITDLDPVWSMEPMPMPRVMSDMVLLPNGRVLIINGVGSGSAGWDLGRNPVLEPVIYNPDGLVGNRFKVQKASEIPRVYHSTAALLRDGRVLVGGSNTNGGYNFTNVLFPTDLSLEAFSPAYLDQKAASLRPSILAPESKSAIGYGENVRVVFEVTGGIVGGERNVKVTMVAPAFNTHSFSQGQRMLELTRRLGSVVKVGKSKYEIEVKMPSSKVLAMPGYYMVFVVHQHVPSDGIWVRIE